MTEGITTRLQRELSQTQQDVLKVQNDVQLLNKKFEDKFESLNDKFESIRTEIKGELKSFLDLLASKDGVASGKRIATELSLHSGATGSTSS